MTTSSLFKIKQKTRTKTKNKFKQKLTNKNIKKNYNDYQQYLYHIKEFQINLH